MVRATVQSVTDVSVFSSPACNSSPVTFYLQKKRKRNGEGNVQSKKQHTVSWKDTESCSTTATDATQCSINEKNTCHICKIVFKKSSRWAICPYCKKKIHLACKKGDVSSCPMNV